MTARPPTGPVIEAWPFTQRPPPRVGSALNPLYISRLQGLCDTGYPARWQDLLNELRQKDTFLHSLLQTRETALLSKGWTVSDAVRPGKKKPTAKAIKRAAYCRELLSKIDGLERSLAHLVDAVYKGYSVVQIVWERRGGKFVPAALEPVHSRRFAFGADGGLYFFDEGNSDVPHPGIDFRREAPYNFIVHTPRVTGDALPREGLGRLLCWYSAFRSWAWRDWLLYAELYGKPITTLKYDRQSTQAEDETLAQRIVDELTATNRAIYPNNMDLMVEWAKSTGSAGVSPCEAILARCGSEMALAVLGQQQTTADVTGGMGARGDTRDLVRKDICSADGLSIGESITRDLIGAIYDVTWGDREELCSFGFNTQEAQDAQALLQALKLGSELGMRVPVAHAHDVIGWPVAADEEPVLGESAPAMRPLGAPGPQEPKEDEGEPETDPGGE